MDDYNENSIRPQLKYEDLREETEQKLFTSVNRDTVIIIEFIGAFVLGFVMSRAGSMDPDFALTLLFKNVTAVIGIMIMIVSAFTVFNGFRHIVRYVRIYKADFRRIEERLSKSDIYMKIPEEDINKYNNILKLIVISWKNRKKTLEK